MDAVVGVGPSSIGTAVRKGACAAGIAPAATAGGEESSGVCEGAEAGEQAVETARAAMQKTIALDRIAFGLIQVVVYGVRSTMPFMPAS